MKKGESVILIKSGYRISYILPCAMERGKKMGEAKLDLKIPAEEMFALLEKKFKMKYYPDLPAGDIVWEGKKIVVFPSRGCINLKIMRAKDRDDVLKTAEMFYNLFSKKD